MNILDKSITEYRVVWRKGYSGPWQTTDCVVDTSKNKVFARLMRFRNANPMSNKCYAIASRKCQPWSICLSTIPTEVSK